ncbi:MAG: FMN-binding protein [Spirochaetales bacterium]|nr:FMN-binding protein [Spirochaetales bacterium]MCF7938889.1 FMN-binding protein [Spirochaetales bacterium]
MKITAVFLAILLFPAVLSGCKGIEEAEAAKQLEIKTPDLHSVEDGRWTGNWKAGPVSVEIALTVRSGRIESVELTEHDNWRGEAAEVLVDTIAAEQSLDVDTISGATISSKVILKAAEKALEKGTR